MDNHNLTEKLILRLQCGDSLSQATKTCGTDTASARRLLGWKLSAPGLPSMMERLAASLPEDARANIVSAKNSYDLHRSLSSAASALGMDRPRLKRLLRLGATAGLFPKQYYFDGSPETRQGVLACLEQSLASRANLQQACRECQIRPSAARRILEEKYGTGDALKLRKRLGSSPEGPMLPEAVSAQLVEGLTRGQTLSEASAACGLTPLRARTWLKMMYAGQSVPKIRRQLQPGFYLTENRKRTALRMKELLDRLGSVKAVAARVNHSPQHVYDALLAGNRAGLFRYLPPASVPAKLARFDAAKVAQALAESDTLAEFEGKLGITAYIRNKLLVLHGLSWSRPTHRPTKEQLMARYLEAAAKLGHPPSSLELQRNRICSGLYGPMMRLWGGIQAFRQEAGIEDPWAVRSKPIKLACLDYYRRLARKLGSTPTVSDMRKNTRSSKVFESIRRQWRSIKAFRLEAGFAQPVPILTRKLMKRASRESIRRLQEQGLPTVEICRRLRLSQRQYSRLKEVYGLTSAAGVAQAGAEQGLAEGNG